MFGFLVSEAIPFGKREVGDPYQPHVSPSQQTKDFSHQQQGSHSQQTSDFSQSVVSEEVKDAAALQTPSFESLDRETLGSDDDDSDDCEEEIVPEDIILCQYDKVCRVANARLARPTDQV